MLWISYVTFVKSSFGSLALRENDLSQKRIIGRDVYLIGRFDASIASFDNGNHFLATKITLLYDAWKSEKAVAIEITAKPQNLGESTPSRVYRVSVLDDVDLNTMRIDPKNEMIKLNFVCNADNDELFPEKTMGKGGLIVDTLGRRPLWITGTSSQDRFSAVSDKMRQLMSATGGGSLDQWYDHETERPQIVNQQLAKWYLQMSDDYYKHLEGGEDLRITQWDFEAGGKGHKRGFSVDMSDPGDPEVSQVWGGKNLPKDLSDDLRQFYLEPPRPVTVIDESLPHMADYYNPSGPLATTMPSTISEEFVEKNAPYWQLDDDGDFVKQDAIKDVINPTEHGRSWLAGTYMFIAKEEKLPPRRKI